MVNMKRKYKLIFTLMFFLCGKVVVQAQNDVCEAVSDSLTLKPVENLLMYEDSIFLSEINIVASKPLVKTEVDKITYSVEDDPDSKTNTLLEMFSKVPMITVDGDDNIRVNGSTSFKIYMNNKPSNMLSGNPREVLRSIPANTIKKIEVITEPGARYDAEGVSGVLNIITKSAEFEGYNANLNAILLKNVSTASGFMTMKYGKFSLSGNYSYNQYRNKAATDYRRQQLNNLDESILSMHNEVQSKSPFHYGALESSFEIDSLNLITLSGAIDMSTSKYTQGGEYSMVNSMNDPVYSYKQAKDSRSKWGSSSLKFDYQHMFKRNKKEILTLSYLFDCMPDDLVNEFSLTDRKGDSPSLQYMGNYNRQVNQAKLSAHIFQADYVNPFNTRHSMEGGLKYTRRNSSSNAASEIRESEALKWQPSPFQPLTKYNHAQNIMAVYAGYIFTQGKWGVNTGLRMEHAWQNIIYEQGNGSDFDSSLTDLIPSLSTSYKMNDNNQFRMSYNVRLRRPGIDRLNPYVLLSGTDIRYGNPFLTSDKHHKITSSYSYLSAKINIQASASYIGSRGSIGEYHFFDKDGILNKTYDHILNTKGGSLTAFIGYNPFLKTSVTVNGILNYLSIQVKDGLFGSISGLHNEGLCGSAYLNFSQKFNKGWRFVFSVAFMQPEITLGEDTASYFYYGMSVVKTFINEKLTIMLRAQDFLRPYNITTYQDTYPDFIVSQSSKVYNRNFGISIGYRFGNLKANIRKATRSIENDNSNFRYSCK